ncbi:MAG: hypothetical protein K0Q79_1884 [Flavipsychrobacter sp.]|jgi:hypothetical protein|nr:hypothetical protein [Flavipsychrobacter sp.]
MPVPQYKPVRFLELIYPKICVNIGKNQYYRWFLPGKMGCYFHSHKSTHFCVNI